MSFTDTFVSAKDALLTAFKRRIWQDDDGRVTPVNAEHPDQRAALLAAFNPLASDATLHAIAMLLSSPLTIGLPPGAATDARLEAVRALLAGNLTVGLPVGAATDAKLETLRALLAAPLTVGLPVGAATNAELETIRTLLAATLSVSIADPGLLAATSGPLVGVTTASAQVLQFIPQLKRALNLTLAFNNIAGTVQLLRSKDGTQANAKPMTALGNAIYSFTADAQEQIAAETQSGATYWLSLPPVAGISYDLRQ